MVRMSDILKKKMEAAGFSRPEANQLASPKDLNQGQGEHKPQEMQIAKAMKETQPDKAVSQSLYLTGLSLAKEILNNAKSAKPINLVSLKDLVAKIVDHLLLGDKELLSLFYENSQENYLYAHAINVLILSIDLGLALGFNKSKLNELGLAAFLHDIGMSKLEEIYLQPRSLSEEEYNQIKKHPLWGAEILAQLKDIPGAITLAVKEEHERMNAKGYPEGLNGAQISEYARIIGLIDVYEALTHERSYRKKYLAHEAIKELLINSASLFDQAILKVLINQVGLYPIGSWVELNTNEIGKVITNNEEFPLRPVVKLIFDSVGLRLSEPRVVNLAKQLNLFIKRPLSDEEVLKKIKEEVDNEKST